MRVQKMHGLYGLKQQIVEISGDVTGVEQTTITTTTREDSASQLVCVTSLLICETLSLAIYIIELFV